MIHCLLLGVVSSPPERSLLFIVPVVLGFVGVYLLLPRVRRYPLFVGAALAVLAVLFAGWLLVWDVRATVPTALFYIFSFIALVSGGLMIVQQNPVRAALSFALVVLSTCGLFLLQAAPFLMAATIIIYAGAIIVTFLFVIMLAQQAGYSNADLRSREPFLSSIAGFALLGTLVYVLQVDLSTESTSYLASPYDRAAFERLLEQTARAEQKNSAAAIAAALPDNVLDEYTLAAQSLRGAPGSFQLANVTDQIRSQWLIWKLAGNTAAMKEGLSRLLTAGRDVAATRDIRGQARMPGQNVAYLGRTLFSTYLLPVELGGTLLLVATIGAIAIAARRTEGLR